ncbi:Asp23/Gls24 family envelope stress response protein [Kribbella antibiotica]|uniref:Asp23/Gls24 family envelope stress response protein n=1 Tax=Kribbella antibiotica TaxID=190195 RepID=A0A4R4Z5Y9_9ACTN|nr:Asp23/Gls24 family envelope stress response protein [Kribbella antibiotica]TDD51512.1 Asp23/Gls24 family envelope stress response protein [Kribbella antibiotica]
MEMNPEDAVTDLHPLPCGRTVEDVWDEIESGELSEHRATCPHCRTAQAGLEQLIEATQFLIDDPVDVPSGLLDRIMTAVRADLNLGRTIPLSTEPAEVEVSVHALNAVLRYAVDGTTGVRARQCRIELSEPGAVRVWMSVALEFGAGQVGALDEARQRVSLALRGQIGLELESLDFEVVDVWTKP